MLADLPAVTGPVRQLAERDRGEEDEAHDQHHRDRVLGDEAHDAKPSSVCGSAVAASRRAGSGRLSCILRQRVVEFHLALARRQFDGLSGSVGAG